MGCPERFPVRMAVLVCGLFQGSEGAVDEKSSIGIIHWVGIRQPGGVGSDKQGWGDQTQWGKNRGPGNSAGAALYAGGATVIETSEDLQQFGKRRPRVQHARWVWNSWPGRGGAVAANGGNWLPSESRLSGDPGAGGGNLLPGNQCTRGEP